MGIVRFFTGDERRERAEEIRRLREREIVAAERLARAAEDRQ
jgi:hypothetical protein